MTTNFYHAHADSSHFSFDAFDQTAPGAKAALVKGLKAHAKSVGMDSQNTREWLADMDDAINVLAVQFGAAYIDNDRQIR